MFILTIFNEKNEISNISYYSNSKAINDAARNCSNKGINFKIEYV